MDKNQLLLQMSYCMKTAKNSKALSLKYKVRQCRLHRAKTFRVQSTLQKANTVSFTVQLYFAVQIQFYSQAGSSVPPKISLMNLIFKSRIRW